MLRRHPYLFLGALLLSAASLPAEDAKKPAAEAPPEPAKPIFESTPPLEIGAKHDFPETAAPNSEAASQLKGLCTVAEFQALPEANRYVYSFDPWPSDKDNLEATSFTFNFRLGGNDVTSEKIAFTPSGGGPNSKATFARSKDESGKYTLKGLGNLDWSGKTNHTFKFNKPVSAFGVVLNSSGDVGIRKFYWQAAKELNGYPLSYTLSDGTIVQLGERDVQGALLKGETQSFVGVIDKTGRGIVSFTYTLCGLAGNKAQSLGISQLAFATSPKPAVAPVINLRASCDFEAPDSIVGSAAPLLEGLVTLDDFRFIAANMRWVYRFDTWPSEKKELGSDTAEFAFDTNGKGSVTQKVTITAKDGKLAQTMLKTGDDLPYPVLSGLGSVSKKGVAEQTLKFEKPVWAVGLTYRSTAETRLAETSPVSYTLSDGTVVNLGKAGAPASVLSKEGKTFVGVKDTSDKGIASVTFRIQGTGEKAQPLVIEDLAFALAGPPPGNWRLVMEDNFDGDKLNPAYWVTGYKFVDVINNEYQAYVPENVVVANGLCTIKVEQREAQNTDRNGKAGQKQKFASGAFTSYDKFTATYGYFEARIRMPHARGAGVWPAFWMLPDRGQEFGDKVRGSYRTKEYGTGIEIDIFEYMPWWKRPEERYPIHVGCIWSYGKVTESDPAPHGYGGYAQDNNGWGPQELTYTNPDTEFHTYGLYWSPERLIWYLDGKPIFRAKDPQHMPDVPHYFLFNIALSGNGWGKSVDKKNPTMAQIIEDMPNSMEIDYFRAYAGTLDEAMPAPSTDDPSVIRKYAPPAPDTAEATPPKPAPPATSEPTPKPPAETAPANAAISSPSSG